MDSLDIVTSIIEDLISLILPENDKNTNNETGLQVAKNQQHNKTTLDFKKTRESGTIKHLFHMGCGFTEFLCQVFFHFDLDEVQQCRLVCSTWRDFIDGFVWARHPIVRNYNRWVEGAVEYKQIHCGLEVRVLTSDQKYVFCATKTGHVIVFNSKSFTPETVLRGTGSIIWQLKSGGNILVATTDVSVLIWKKKNLTSVARLRHGSKGEPYLDVENDLFIVPGATKYVCQVLEYNKSSESISGIRYLDHGKFWVLGASIDGRHVLSLSLFAYGTNTTMELRLWDIADGACLRTIIMGGGVSGSPALRFPFAFLSTSAKGLEIWNIEKNEKIRSLSTSVCGYQFKNQFMFVLDKHFKLKVFKIQEITTSESNLEKVWSREIVLAGEEAPRPGGIPRFFVELSRVLAICSGGRSRDVIHVVKMAS